MKLFRKSILAALSAALLSVLALFAAACGGEKEKVGYTAEVYLEAESGYALSEEHSFRGEGEVGESVTVTAPAIGGYTFNAAYAENVVTLTLAEEESANVFKLYYDEETVAPADLLVYDANVPRNAVARGNMENGKVTDGKAVAAESGYTVTGYRFAGWSYTANGTVDVKPGDTVAVSGRVVLYAVWEQGYSDRFGGTDFVFVPAEEEGTLIMSRGGMEFKTALQDDLFSFTLPDGSTLAGKLFSDRTFAYKQEDLEGTYAFHSSYYNQDDENGEIAPDPDTTLTLDAYGNAAFTQLVNGVRTTERGYITYYSYGENPEYFFVITEGENADSGFIFRFDTVDGQRVYTNTNGEQGLYTLALSPDGIISYLQNYDLYLDGYGNLTFQYINYTGEWTGRYWIENVYEFGTDYRFRLHLLIRDDVNGNLGRLGYDVVDGILSLTGYTMTLIDGSSVYVEPHEEAGEYTNAANGSKLVLDGFRNFPDSAVYTLNGTPHYGSYEALWSQKDNLTIVLHEMGNDGSVLGNRYTFKIDIRQYEERGNLYFDILDTFSLLSDTPADTYRLLDGNGFGDSVLTILDTPYTGVAGAREAEFGTINMQGGYTKLASGYVTGNTLGASALNTFTRTALEEGADAQSVPKSMIFELNSAYDSNYFLYDVYFVYAETYEEGGSDKETKYYNEVTDAAGTGAKFWYLTLPAQDANIGAIYFSANGDVYTGRFTYDAQQYFGPAGYITVINALTNSVDYYYFDLELDAGGAPKTFETLTELEYPLYTLNDDGAPDQMVRLIVRGEEALWAENANFDSGVVRGTLKPLGKSASGEDMMGLYNADDIEVFRFIIVPVMYYEPGYGEQEILCYRAYDKNFDKTYTSADGTLVLDGFRNAEFTDGAGDVHRGNYTLSTDNKIVYMDAGTQRYTFDISATLILTDGVYGTYAMYAGDEWWDVTFDGLGNATAASRLGHRSAQGMYIVEREDEVMLFINIEPGVNSYRLQLFSYEEHGEAFVFDEDLEGAYVGDDWTVLLLDGYGSGAYYFPDGSGMTAIYYSVLDEEIGYINIRTESMIEQNLILNTADKTMAYPSYADRRYVYYGEDLSALIIDPSGEIFMDYTSGYYIFMDGSNGVYRAYLMDENAEYHAVDLGGKLGADVFELGGKKYYLSSSAQRVTLTGTVEVSYESTQSSEAASLTFTLTGEELVRAQGTFRVGEETYAVDLVNYFRDDTGYHGLAIVDWSRYEYSAFTEYTYGGNGTGTFKVVVAAQEMTMTDAFEQENGITSTLTEYRVGFGPINITSRKLSGHVFVGNGQYLDFQDADIEIVYLYESDLGNRYNAVFTVNGTTYSIQYNKVEDEYGLYLLGTYETVETDGYTVGIIKYFYSNDAFNHDYAVGAFCDFILYKGTGEERTPVVAMSKMVNAGGLSGWYVDIGNYDPVAETGYPDTIYLLTFGNAQSSVTVEKYGFMQASEPDGTPAHSYCVNLCLENGQIKSIAAFNFDGVFYTVTSAVYSETEEGWIMTCTDGNEERTYLVTLPVDAEGNHLKNHDGNWQMTLEEYEAQ